MGERAQVVVVGAGSAGGNTAAPTVMIGEKASELVAASLGLALALGEEVAA